MGVRAMSKWERFDDMMARLIALAFLGFAFGVIIVMLWIHKAVLS